MTDDPRSIETSIATVSLTGPRFVEQRIKPTARFETEGLKENNEALEQLCNGTLCAVLVVIPAEVPVNLPVVNVDHFRSEREKRCILAMAVVTDSAIMHATAKLYFMYFQQAFPAKVFEEEGDARTWLKEQLTADQP